MCSTLECDQFLKKPTRWYEWLYKPFGAFWFVLTIISFIILGYVIGDTLYPLRFCWGYWLHVILVNALLLTIFPSAVFIFLGVQICKWRYNDGLVQLNVVKTKADQRDHIFRFLYILLGLAVFSAFLLSFAYFILVLEWTNDTSPITQLGISVTAGLMRDSFTIERDSDMIPRVTTSSHTDSLYAMGWLHASERYYQMDMNRKAALGELTSLLGSKAIQHDVFYRTLGFKKAAQTAWASMSLKGQLYLQNYVNGVNDFIDSSKGKPQRPQELRVQNYDYTTWSTIDSLAILKMFQWERSGNYLHELTRLRLLTDKGMSPAQVKVMDPPYPLDSTAYASFLPSEFEESTVNLAPNIAAENASIALEDFRVADLQNFIGRNTTSGNTIDVNSVEELHFGWDPSYLSTGNKHRGSSFSAVTFKETTQQQFPVIGTSVKGTISAPTEFYLMQIESTDATNGRILANGATYPGMPGFVQGRNQYATFSVTPSFSDATDIFVLDEVVPGTSYRVAGVTYEYIKRTEEIGAGKGSITVLESLYGPILNDAIKNAPGLGKPLALKWTGLSNDTTMEWYATAWTSATTDDFLLSSRTLYNCPPSTIIWAGSESFPAVISAGLIPIRADGHTGLFPVQSNTTYDWRTFYTPYATNRWPTTKFFVVGGGRVVGRGFRQRLGLDYEDEYTSKRLQQNLTSLVASGNVISVSRFQNLFSDKSEPLFNEFVSILNTLPDSAAKSTLLAWNRICNGATSACGLWRNWYWEMTKLGANAGTGVTYWDKPRYILAALRVESTPACGTAGCIAFANAALQVAASQTAASSRYVPFRNYLLDGGAWDCLCNRGAFVSGSPNTIQPVPDHDPTKSEVRQGCTYRSVSDYNSAASAATVPHVFQIPLGNTGWQWLRYYTYDGMLSTWTNGGWTSMSFSVYKRDRSQIISKA